MFPYFQLKRMYQIPSHLIHLIVSYCNIETSLFIFNQSGKYREFLLNNKFFFNEFIESSQWWDSTAIMDWAAENGHLKIIEFLYDRKKSYHTMRAMKRANRKRKGHLDRFKNINYPRMMGHSNLAIDLAAKNGHLEIVRFLVKKQLEKWPS